MTLNDLERQKRKPSKKWIDIITNWIGQNRLQHEDWCTTNIDGKQLVPTVY